jgi:Kef-type K+ transport system membrane component KefB
MRLPKVTAYLLVGLLLGPSVLNLVPREHAVVLDPVLKLAMSLVLFNLGCHYPLKHLRRIAPRILPLSLGELAATFLLVTLGVSVCGATPSVAALLGSLALATAPATTVLVLKEFESEGQITEYTGALVVLNNLASIVAFEIVFFVIELKEGPESASSMASLGWLARDLSVSIVLGVTAGLLVSYCCGFVSPSRWLVLLVAATTFLLGICETFGLPYMLTFLVLGMIVANTSELTSKIVVELDKLTGLLCVLFFAVHGAEMDLSKFVTIGLIGVAYTACRVIGKYSGIRLAAIVMGETPEVKRWLGTSLLAQAGAAIGLSTLAVNRSGELGGQVQTVILGSVVFFELLGPVLIRESVLRAGEVPIGHVIHHRSQSTFDQLRSVWDRIVFATGRTPTESIDREFTAADLMRRNVKGIPQSASFDEVLSFIEHSHDNTYPVVDVESTVVGLIRYPLLASVFFDATVSPLVRAEDLATTPRTVLYPDDSISRVQEAFRRETDDCIPVVAREGLRTLLGVVRRGDFTHLMISKHRAANEGPVSAARPVPPERAVPGR